MHFIHDITCIIYDTSSTMYDITFTICVTSQRDSICDITHSMFMTYPLYMASHTVLWEHSHCVTSQTVFLTSQPVYLCHHTQCTNFIKPSVSMKSPPLYLWHHMHYIWHSIPSLWHHTTLFKTSSPLYVTSHSLYLTSRPLYLCHHTHSTMILQPVYVWYHI